MSGLDIMFCVQELKNAIGMRIDKVYEMNGVFLLRLGSCGKRRDLLIEPGRRVHFTTHEHKPPKQPSSFAMLLRKHLTNNKLSAVEQPDFERLLELKFLGVEEHVLITELFGEGNLVLCDGELKIIQPYRFATRRDRVFRAGERYVYPTVRSVDLLKLDFDALVRAVHNAPDLVRGLAVGLGIGGSLANELCKRAGVKAGVKPSELETNELEAIVRSLNELLAQKPEPNVVYSGSKPIDVLPFKFLSRADKKIKIFETFNEALDVYFSALAIRSATRKKMELFEQEVSKLQRRLADQEKHFAEFYAKAGEVKRKADLVAIYHAQIDEAFANLRGKNAPEELEKARRKGEAWAKLVRKLSNITVELALADLVVALDFRRSAFDNASQLYERYKKLAGKIAGAKDAAEQTKRKLEELLAVGPSGEE